MKIFEVHFFAKSDITKTDINEVLEPEFRIKTSQLNKRSLVISSKENLAFKEALIKLNTKSKQLKKDIVFVPAKTPQNCVFFKVAEGVDKIMLGPIIKNRNLPTVTYYDNLMNTKLGYYAIISGSVDFFAEKILESDKIEVAITYRDYSVLFKHPVSVYTSMDNVVPEENDYCTVTKFDNLKKLSDIQNVEWYNNNIIANISKFSFAVPFPIILDPREKACFCRYKKVDIKEASFIEDNDIQKVEVGSEISNTSSYRQPTFAKVMYKYGLRGKLAEAVELVARYINPKYKTEGDAALISEILRQYPNGDVTFKECINEGVSPEEASKQFYDAINN